MSIAIESTPTLPALPLDPDPLPFRLDPDGSARMGSSRVLFVLVVRAFLDGDTAEGIVQRYDSADLADVYAAIAYYLRHRPAVDAYVAAWEAAGEAIRRKIEQRQGPQAGLRERLLARQRARQAAATPAGDA
jgi:uncharacterized protein (DUF433 family)